MVVVAAYVALVSFVCVVAAVGSDGDIMAWLIGEGRPKPELFAEEGHEDGHEEEDDEGEAVGEEERGGRGGGGRRSGRRRKAARPVRALADRSALAEGSADAEFDDSSLKASTTKRSRRRCGWGEASSRPCFAEKLRQRNDEDLMLAMELRNGGEAERDALDASLEIS